MSGSGANFVRAKLHRASFLDAYLKKVDFSGADLRGADLKGADLTGTNFTNANLKEASLEGAKIDRIIFCSTIMSNGEMDNTDCP